jgi:hypothetical protein
VLSEDLFREMRAARFASRRGGRVRQIEKKKRRKKYHGLREQTTTPEPEAGLHYLMYDNHLSHLSL